MSNENISRKQRCIDVVFCIDGTGSMSDCINTVKDNADKFQVRLVEEMAAKGSDIEETRVKVIVFRDYGCDGEGSMHISDFFTLPADEAEYRNFLANVRAQGGGDGPENGLEALYYAMKSPFEFGDDDRQVIVLFTDAEALDLGERKDSPQYPADMVDMGTLTNMWYGKDQAHETGLNQLTKRLVIFAPNGTKYQSLADTWNLTWFHAVHGETGLQELTFDDIVKLISASASAKARK